MKLLVDVPDDKYREFMEENAYEVIYDGYWVARVIAEGVPIKDEEFFSMLMKSVMTKEQFDEILQEVAKRPQGEWEESHIFSCGNILRMGLNVIEHNCKNCGRWSIKWERTIPDNFCPNCGADMRGAKNDNSNAF